MANVGVIYLCRFAEGQAPVRDFLQSYHDYPAGVDHDLHVIFKGFPNESVLASFHRLFEGLPINRIMLDDDGYDIGSYILAAAAAFNHRLMFLNTFSRILAPNWLRNFDLALNLPAIGVAGATGSWQSAASQDERAIRTILYNVSHLPAYTHKHALRSRRVGSDEASRRARRPLRRYLFFPIYYLANLYEYGRHPNPHIRTNAFMIERERFLALRHPPFKSKRRVLNFESGRRSMTRQVLAEGLRPVVVDRTGAVYGIPEWESSSTFHAGGQKNLVVADRRTAEYMVASPELRRFLESQAWSDPWSWTP